MVDNGQRKSLLYLCAYPHNPIDNKSFVALGGCEKLHEEHITVFILHYYISVIKKKERKKKCPSDG